ncbi:tRNA threonylcarbamoyladenosine biosynthesis protein TsaE [Alicyclobacillus sacchari]|uniref:tRNA threonylcarbamoyladenosine biosynthesis protein TsaE n=1 Tax=Alicyclobacillus sacchari TaxID=392010 RepID=A0A4R8LQZ8_9BACL|nr:tRNA (adenosine(37)-N6)-threonylcarbamoyltransferase complex ATPase subunit type 1 TsaE [Alicyclobacillus sacchari]TDY49990.1 tRNA threonylcarbamoyladenosine biosynthesis protein TsaE [Alicyclobacillus sacchari]GMA57697.1 tRNA (adenosine(37)-N6)-threonylcarbamoyltransferase complex ATPase subunit type 1 TsaE [Alicyclobacillus sacchari]
MQEQWEQVAHTPDATDDLGERLGQVLRPGDVVLLSGPVGVGKTHFAKAVARGLGVRSEVTSPTFTIVGEYEGRISFVHMDLYRLYQDPDDVAAQLSDDILIGIGFDDYFDGSRAVLIEWPQGVRQCLDGYLDISMQPLATGERVLQVKAVGASARERMKEWVGGWA